MSKKRRKRKTCSLYIEYRASTHHVGYEWYDRHSKRVYDSIETIYHNDYVTNHFQPYHIMTALNCRKIA